MDPSTDTCWPTLRDPAGRSISRPYRARSSSQIEVCQRYPAARRGPAAGAASRYYRWQARTPTRTARYPVNVPELKLRHSRVGPIGVDQAQPAETVGYRRKGEVYDIMVRVVDQKHRCIRPAALAASFLSTSVKQHPEALGVAVLPVLCRHLLARWRQLGHVLDVELFIVGADQESAATCADRVNGS